MESDTTALAEQESLDLQMPFVVAIGASAGGLEALTQFFRSMPIDSGLAFVVIQHLSPDFKSFMPELLGRETKMHIELVQQDMVLKQNTVYLIPPRHNIALENGRFLLTEQDNQSSLKLPIDIFFRSLAQDAGPRAIGIVLSGTGADGSRGIQEIWDSGGFVIAQNPETAQFDSMPISSMETKKVHLVAAPEEMPTHIQQYVVDRNSALANLQLRKQADSYLSRILTMLTQQFEVNFEYYRTPTVMRRLERRLIKTKCHQLEEYHRYIQENPDELSMLFYDLLITVTAFFRDRDAFNYLAEHIFDDLIRKANEKNQQLRLWVAACSTGEEAYSIAMLLDDLQKRQDVEVEVKIFATDVNESVLQKANYGIYTPDEIESLPAYYRKKYLIEHKKGYQIVKPIRDKVIFAPHNLLQNPPFTNLDFVSCRNLLIYLDPTVQRRILSYMHFGMKVGGTLFLGPSETIGSLEDEFQPLEKRWRIFRKRRDVRLTEALNVHLSSSAHSFRTMEKMSPKTAEIFKRNAWQESLLNQLIPNGVIINEDFQLVHTFGEAGLFLQQPSGSPTLNILQMVEGNLRAAIQTGIGYFDDGVKKQLIIPKIVNGNDSNKPLTIIIKPIELDRQGLTLFLLKFDAEVEEEVVDTPQHAKILDYSITSQTRIDELEQELSAVRKSLQITMEELETTNEELQSTNEELIASNEQLQGTNEELHSVNEELHMVNTEYRQKIAEMLALNDEVANLQRSSKLITVFLDGELKIRAFTPAATDLFDLQSQDVGRPITYLLYMLNLEQQDVNEIVQQVLIDEITVEQEIRLRNGRHYLLRVLPYLRENKPSYGLVINLVDITSLKQVQSRLEASMPLISLAEDTNFFGYWEYNLETQVVTWSSNVEEIFKLPQNSFGGTYDAYMDLVYPEDRARLRSGVEETIKTKGGYQVIHRTMTPDGSLNWVIGKGVYHEEDGQAVLFGTVSNISEEIEFATELISEVENAQAKHLMTEQQVVYQHFLTNAGILSLEVDQKGNIIEQQVRWEQFTSQQWPAYRDFGWLAKIHPSDQNKLSEAWQTAVSDQQSFELEIRLWQANKDDYQRMQLHALPQINQKEALLGWMLFIQSVHK